MKGEQLLLSIQLRRAASFETFFAGPNADLISTLRSTTHSGPGAYLFGATGSGKTHLLQAAAREHPGAAYLPLEALQVSGPEILEGFEQAPLLCLDDLDAVSGQPIWAVPLLRLLDARRARPVPVILSALTPPERLETAVPDLRSRLSALGVHGLKPLSELQRADFLRMQAQARGLSLAEDAARWLLNTQLRDNAALVAGLDALDRAALSAQRRLTLPFVMQVLSQIRLFEADAKPC